MTRSSTQLSKISLAPKRFAETSALTDNLGKPMIA